MLREASLGDVEAANIDGFQGREHEVIVISLTRCNAHGRLGHFDDGRRLNVALTRAKRGLAVIGDKDTLRFGYESGLRSFMRYVYARGAVIEMPPELLRDSESERDEQRQAAAYLSGDREKIVIPQAEATSTAMAISRRQP